MFQAEDDIIKHYIYFEIISFIIIFIKIKYSRNITAFSLRRTHHFLSLKLKKKYQMNQSSIH